MTIKQPLSLNQRQLELTGFLKELRLRIIKSFEALESNARFQMETWDYDQGEGGGEMAVIRAKHFEKAAVNRSGIKGENFPMQDGQGAFFATGVSLITHMRNPHAPTVHFNIRYIETKDKWWFGGGYDLTPMGFPYEEDTSHFHDTARAWLDRVDDRLYPRFKDNAAKYFFIPHWAKERGVGGIFFDHYNTGDFEKDCAMWKAVGNSFLSTILPIYDRRISLDHCKADRQRQLEHRGHYVEFNLLYDRGTKFGFQSGGNPKAILCSMPPLASW